MTRGSDRSLPPQAQSPFTTKFPPSGLQAHLPEQQEKPRLPSHQVLKGDDFHSTPNAGLPSKGLILHTAQPALLLLKHMWAGNGAAPLARAQN